MDKTDQPNSNLDELTTKRGQSSVSVSYSPPSPHTFMPYDLPKIWPNRQNKYLTMLGGCGELHDIEEKLRIRGKKKRKKKHGLLFQLMQIWIQECYFFAQVFSRFQAHSCNLQCEMFHLICNWVYTYKKNEIVLVKLNRLQDEETELPISAKWVHMHTRKNISFFLGTSVGKIFNSWTILVG